ncbi:unnamed protein product [Heligmosomoides polygyrus]|uniref:Transposase n=1 Tax=Heligmosomoides polygyrus TaxID=6339 RepID=A0A183GRR0_HELPZ|nr:unnamed protein product [Heligmosomoides polygyrus]
MVMRALKTKNINSVLMSIADRLHAVGKSNRCGKWAAHQHSNTKKAARLAIAGFIIRKTKSSDLYDSIMTSDEKWIR